MGRGGALLLLAALLPAASFARAHPRHRQRHRPATSPAVVLTSTREEAPSPAPAPGRRRIRFDASVPRVTYTTMQGAYLSIGHDEGVQVGMSLPLHRHGLLVGSCRVLEVAEHYAICQPKPSARLGDTVVSPPRPFQPRVKPLPPMLTAQQLEHQRAQLERAEFDQVDFRAQSAGIFSHLRGEVDFGTAFWVNTDNANSNFGLQFVDIALRGADLGGGFQAFADISVLNWSQRSALTRFLPQAGSTQIFIRQLEVSYRTSSFPLSFSAGRLLPWHTPGLGAMDGVQAGWHDGSGMLELGILAGSLPDFVTTVPAFQRPLAGVYFTLSSAGAGEQQSWSQLEAAVTAQQVPNAGFHYALDALGLLSVGRNFDGAAELRVGGGALPSPYGIEAVRLDLNTHPSEHTQLQLGARYMYNAVDQVVEPGVPLPPTIGVIHASGAYSWDWTTVALALSGGYDRDITTALARGYAGPELSLPRVLGIGGLGLGYEESLGWVEGRDAYVQATLAPAPPVRLTGRLSYYFTRGPSSTVVAAEHGVSAYLLADVSILRWLAFRAQVLTQEAVSPLSDTPRPFGITATGSIHARF